jgi:pimeloyl-ACP methyl ester carboxylesterase
MAIDLPPLGLTFDVPIFFFEGTCDQQTPMELAEHYFANIVAPHKEFVRFEGCHHFVVMNRPEAFLRELLARVRPLL